ncbi:putative bifunctional diguanylate cyclase/phosphodiesterase [Novosphingobium huizhouense]|uniref:putative bifunctional diguanylate cyclase/phosphodiesterase n=1 Tax=Novosphingobium huizhouense TaxID=2866625 RepID=UPI001CD8F633|nr:EAL domain-containing protein [Novosphingobium huizhouense]
MTRRQARKRSRARSWPVEFVGRRFDTLGGRIALLYAALLAGVMAVTILVAGSGISIFAQEAAQRDLAASARVFDQIIATRQRQMAQAGEVVARDFGFREALATDDAATLASALQSLRDRASVSEVAVVRLDGSVIASGAGQTIRGTALLPRLEDGADRGVVTFAGTQALAAAVPIRMPDLAGWLVLVNTLGPRDMEQLARLSAVPVGARVADKSSLPKDLATAPLGAIARVGTANGDALVRVSPIASLEAGHNPRLVLTHSLAASLARYNGLRAVLLLICLVGVLAGAWAAIRLSHGIAKPLKSLAEAAKAYGGGAVAKVRVEGAIEVRSLADSFNAMVDAVDEREQQVLHASLHDPLTDLPNRRFFIEKLERAVSRQNEGHRTFVAFIDVDDFKAINDTMGHPVGDQLLRHVAQSLQERFPDAMVARFGGDEFGLLLAGLDPAEDCTVLARRLELTLNSETMVDGRTVLMSASVGIAIGPQDGHGADALLKSADLALYRAKSDGKGAYHFFEPALDAAASNRRRMEIDLRHAIRDGEFELHFQPLFSISQNRVKGFEALMRWPHREFGTVSPATFIPIAEESGLIVQMGEWAVREACRQAALWPDDISVAVNISPRQLASEGLTACIAQALVQSGLPASRLELEITESVFIGNVEKTLKILHSLQALGVRVALDDFGTGYSSLSYLRSFPFDKIKIDQSFVRALEDGGNAHAIVRAITTLADALGMETLAEGVETQELLEALRSEGCDMIQGYLISRPIHGREVADLLATLHPPAARAANG